MPRHIKLIAAFVLTLAATAPMMRLEAAGKSKPLPPDAAFRSQVDELAEKVIKDADRNHNQVLNKHEYVNADEMLEAGLMELGNQGVLGKPLTKGQTVQPDAALVREATVPNPNKVTPEEFKTHAHAVAQQADEYFRQLQAMSAAQRKAMMSRGNRGRRW